MSDNDKTLIHPGNLEAQANGLDTKPVLAIPDVELDSVVGQGASGIVYRGRQSYLDRVVAVKVLNGPMPGAEAQFIERFRREAQILANLEHANIVACYHAGVCDDQRTYIVMEYIDGPTLKDFVDQQGPLQVSVALQILQQIAEALGYAYDHKIIHRDIKAENILLKPGEQKLAGDFPYNPKLADLGIARSVEIDPENSLTSVGVLIGTPSFMAPEQFNAPDSVDYQADIYGLGCLLYFLLTGSKPFVSTDLMQLLAKKINGDYPDVRQINPAVDHQTARLIDDMLAAETSARLNSYAELIQRCHDIGSMADTRELQKSSDHLKKALLLSLIGGVVVLVAAATFGPWKLPDETADVVAISDSGEAENSSAESPGVILQQPLVETGISPPSAQQNTSNITRVESEPAKVLLQSRVDMAFLPDPTVLISSNFQAPLESWGERSGSAAWIAEDEGSGINGLGSGEQFYRQVQPPLRLDGSMALLTEQSKEAGIRFTGADGRYVLLSLQQLGSIYLSIASGRVSLSDETQETRDPIAFIPLETQLLEQARFSIIITDELIQIEVNDRFVGSLQPGFIVRGFALVVDSSTASFRDLRLFAAR